HHTHHYQSSFPTRRPSVLPHVLDSLNYPSGSIRVTISDSGRTFGNRPDPRAHSFSHPRCHRSIYHSSRHSTVRHCLIHFYPSSRDRKSTRLNSSHQIHSYA